MFAGPIKTLIAAPQIAVLAAAGSAFAALGEAKGLNGIGIAP